MAIQCPRRIVSQHPTPLPALAPEKEKHVTSEGPPLPDVATEYANVLVFVTAWGAWPGQGFFLSSPRFFKNSNMVEERV